MDDRRFDDLTRSFAEGVSRRRLISGVAAGVLGGLIGSGGGGGIKAGRATVGCPRSEIACPRIGGTCTNLRTDPQNCGRCGRVCPEGHTCYAGRCFPCPEGTFVCGGACISECEPMDQCHLAGVCDEELGQCTNPPVVDGTPCDDGNACTQIDNCQSGVCTGSNPVVCTALSQCHEIGTCDPQTGECSNPQKADGMPCDDGNLCTDGDTCQAGECVSGAAVVCEPLSQCHEVGVCDPGTGECSNPPKADNTPCDNGDACTTNDTCQGGICASGPGLDCDDGNPCTEDSCSPFSGCQYTTLPEGTPCGTGQICDNQTCREACYIDGVFHNSGAANPTNSCQSCQPLVSTSDWSPVSNETPCDSGNLCTENDFCLDGQCVAGDSVCDDGNPCTADHCNPATGTCSYTELSCPPTTANPCQEDICDPAVGCTRVNVSDGTNMPQCNTPGPPPIPQACYDGQCCISGTGNYGCLADSACCPGLVCRCTSGTPPTCFLNLNGQCIPEDEAD